MASFICDVCGGTIRMQANHVAVCSECGMEYDLDSVRAMAGHGGNHVPVRILNSSAMHSMGGSDIDTESLIVYLTIMRVMESASLLIDKTIKKFETERESRELKYKFGVAVKEKRKLSKRSFDKERRRAAERSSRRRNFFLILTAAALICAAFMYISFFVLKRGKVIDPNAVQELKRDVLPIYLGLAGSLVLGIAGICGLIYTKLRLNRHMKDIAAREEEARQKVEERNRQKEGAMEQLRASFDVWLDKYDRIMQKLEREQAVIRSDLQDAYASNIIPIQFRNIEGIYYLYDYLATSTRSFWEAIMHADLEASKPMLAQTAENNAEEVVKRAQENAKVTERQDTIKRILTMSQQNARSSTLAAKYTAIAAIHSKLLKIMKKDALTFQKAEQWLKKV